MSRGATKSLHDLTGGVEWINQLWFMIMIHTNDNIVNIVNISSWIICWIVHGYASYNMYIYLHMYIYM